MVGDHREIELVHHHSLAVNVGFPSPLYVVNMASVAVAAAGTVDGCVLANSMLDVFAGMVTTRNNHRLNMSVVVLQKKRC